MYGDLTRYRNKIAKGSMQDIAKDRNISLAEAISLAKAVIIVDVSGSMMAYDETQRTRYERAIDALEYYQEKLPGEILIVSFSGDAKFCPNGYPDWAGGNTAMNIALKFAQVADKIPNLNFILISDGAPDMGVEEETLRIAKTYKNKINTVFIGSENDKSGSEFLAKLSALSGGKSVIDHKALSIQNSLKKMLYLEG